MLFAVVFEPLRATAGRAAADFFAGVFLEGVPVDFFVVTFDDLPTGRLVADFLAAAVGRLPLAGFAAAVRFGALRAAVAFPDADFFVAVFRAAGFGVACFLAAVFLAGVAFAVPELLRAVPFTGAVFFEVVFFEVALAFFFAAGADLLLVFLAEDFTAAAAGRVALRPFVDALALPLAGDFFVDLDDAFLLDLDDGI